ncbi:hypothetical protein [Pseudomonas sp. B16120]|uniref:hypothetical protein n=1 Tax=Pseudomonas sp. B16120 TaxID=3235108 RepID=UPI003783A447
MTFSLPYPFDVDYMRRNKVFLLFCPTDRLDDEQRPVLEGRSLLYKLDSTAYQVCPYSDSRGKVDKPINVESLKSLSRHQDTVTDLIRGMGKYLVDQHDDGGSGPDMAQLYALSYMGYKSPSLFFCRMLLNESASIPAVCSVASRFFHGLMNLLSLVALEYNGALAGVRITPAELYDYADTRGHLVGAKESCAASKTTIIKYLSLITESCDGAAQADEHLMSSVDELEIICDLAQVIEELELACLIYETMRCWLWRQTPGYEARADRQKFATPHCLMAKKISRMKDPFEHLLFKRARNLSRTLGGESAATTRFIELASWSVTAAQENSVSFVEIHQGLKSELLCFIYQYAEFIEQHVVGGEFLSADLDVFFGTWPDQRPE